MKRFELSMNLSAEEAYIIYRFLDECESQILEHYGEEIIAEHDRFEVSFHQDEGDLDFDDKIPF